MQEDLSVFSQSPAREAIQDLRDLLSQNRIAFLMGAGCSFDAGLPLMGELTSEVTGSDILGAESKQVLDSLIALYDGGTDQTIEDYMSDLVDYLSVADRRMARQAKETSVEIGGRKVASSELDRALAEIKTAIARVIEDREPNLENHQRFVRSIHQSLEAGKQRRIVDYFVLNYDTLLEDALGMEKIPFTDGFAGGVTGWWEPIAYEDNAFSAHVHKLHGSIDWCLLEEDTLPRRIRRGLLAGAEESAVLIYPSATKFQEVQKDPFAQLLGNLRRVLRTANGEQVVLCICGYGYNDSHIDLEIENAVYQSGGNLTVLAFSQDEGNVETLARWVDDPILRSQIRCYTSSKLIKQGESVEFESPLPWWKFEVLARVLGGER